MMDIIRLTKPSASLEPQSLSINVSLEHIIRESTDFEALKF